MNKDTVLYRQIHPVHLANGVLSSVPFRPSEKDEGLLSFYDGDKTTAEDSHTHYTSLKSPQGLLLESCAVYGITVEEVNAHDLSAHNSPTEESPDHAHVDFNKHADKAIQKISKKLRNLAEIRGCLHPKTS